MKVRLWAGRLLAAAVVYFGWGIGFAQLEAAWLGAAGGLAFGLALVAPLIAGAVARLLDRSRWLPPVAVGLVAVDTLGAIFIGAAGDPLSRDLLLRVVPLVALLGAVLLVSVALARRRSQSGAR